MPADVKSAVEYASVSDVLVVAAGPLLCTVAV